ATGQSFDTIILNDLSASFSSEISQQRAADLAILNCLHNSSGSGTSFGITTFDGHANIYQALASASGNYASLQTRINALNYCGTPALRWWHRRQPGFRLFWAASAPPCRRR